MKTESELFQKVAEILECDVILKRGDNGLFMVTPMQHIELNVAMKRLLIPRIQNKYKLIKQLEYDAENAHGIEKLYTTEEYYEQKMKLLDLVVQCSNCDGWIENYISMVNRQDDSTEK